MSQMEEFIQEIQAEKKELQLALLSCKEELDAQAKFAGEKEVILEKLKRQEEKLQEQQKRIEQQQTEIEQQQSAEAKVGLLEKAEEEKLLLLQEKEQAEQKVKEQAMKIEAQALKFSEVSKKLELLEEEKLQANGKLQNAEDNQEIFTKIDTYIEEIDHCLKILGDKR